MMKFMIAYLAIFIVTACSTPEKVLPSCADAVKPILESYQNQKAEYIGPATNGGVHMEVFETNQHGLAILFAEEAVMADVQLPAEVAVEFSGRCVIPNSPPLSYRAIKVKKPVEKERTL